MSSITAQNVNIRLLRQISPARRSTDDLIIIRLENNNLRVSHTCGDSKVKSNLLLTSTGLADYVDTLLKLVRNDCDPFLSAQICFPGYPTLLFSTARLQNPEVLSQIRAAARDVHESWLEDRATADNASDSDSGDDSSTSISTDSEDDYADMPALVRADRIYPTDTLL